jgi:hypothetical protein
MPVENSNPGFRKSNRRPLTEQPFDQISNPSKSGQTAGILSRTFTNFDATGRRVEKKLVVSPSNPVDSYPYGTPYGAAPGPATAWRLAETRVAVEDA